MTDSSSLAQVISDLHNEATEDYVGLWKVFRLLKEGSQEGRTSVQEVLKVVRALLDDPSMRIGQFSDNVFHPWVGDVESNIQRLASELSTLGHAPGLGEVAWLVRDE